MVGVEQWAEIRRLVLVEQRSQRRVAKSLGVARDTVARALLDYVDLGVTTLLIRGYDPLEDATDYGRELIPQVRAEVARRDAAQAGVAAAGAEAELAGRS